MFRGWQFCKTRSHRRHKTEVRPRFQSVEMLESRELLASDMATIAGLVFNDSNGNGSLDAGETGLGGVTVELTGVNDLSQNIGPLTDVTDAGGTYSFAGLRAGTYQVSQLPPPPTGFNPTIGSSPATVVVSTAQANGTSGTVVDNFNQTSQSVTASTSTTTTDATSVPLAPEAIGGERDMFAQLDSQSGFVNLEANLNFPGQLAFITGPTSTGSRRVVWDGIDVNPGVLNPAGLGGVDLTDGGNTDRFRLLIGSQNGGTARLRIHSSGGNTSEASLAIPITTNGEASGEVFVLYSSFTPVSGPGVDLTSVGAVELEIDPENASDGKVDILESFGQTVIPQNFANDQLIPAIDIEKATNGQDADVATGPVVATGSTVTFSYVVDNTGNTPLGNVSVTDDQGVVPQFVGGDTDSDNLLDISEVWTYQATRVATAGQYTNIGSVVGNPVDENGNDLAGLQDVSDDDPSNHIGVSAGIDIEKATNGQDADTATGPQLAVGSTATFTYVVTNTGTTPLGSVVLTDDQGIVPMLTAGDTDGDTLLDLTETWTYSATRTVTDGQYTNIGTVVGNPVDENGQDIVGLGDATDSDPSNHLGVSAAIDIEKATNGQDADTPTGPAVGVGSTVTFTYVVNNTGSTPLGSVVVGDDQGVVPTFTGGDTDADNLLDVTETWTYQATRTATAGQYVNIGSVTANPVDAGGQDIAGLADVSDSDPSHHVGVSAAIDIEKATNGQDADTATGPQVQVGSNVTFTYVVTNAGDTDLANVVVADDQGVIPALVGGDTDSDNILDLTETWTYEATRVATAGQYTNIGTVTGNPVDSLGADIGGLPDVTDSDPSNHFGFQSGINVEKSTNGQDADTPDLAPEVFTGETVSLNFTVTNTGNVPLSNVAVSDDNGTPADAADDFFATFSGGDANSDALLDPPEVWNFTATTTATAGLVQNVGTVTANDPANALVQDQDLSHHEGIPLPPIFSKRRFLASG